MSAGSEQNGPSSWVEAKYLDERDRTAAVKRGRTPSWDRIPESLANDPQGWASCTFQYFVVTYTEAKRWYANKYDQNGFHSSGHILGSEQATRVEAQPWFTERPDPYSPAP